MLVFERLTSVPTLVGARPVLGDGQCMLYSLIIATDNNSTFPHPMVEDADTLRIRLRESLLTWSCHEYASRMPVVCAPRTEMGVDWYACKFLTAHSGHHMHNTAVRTWRTPHRTACATTSREWRIDGVETS